MGKIEGTLAVGNGNGGSEEREEPLLTEDEAAIYDRQLRVWGVLAQKRLSESHVLVVNMSGTIAEACKNVVLAGVGSITLLDDGRLVSPSSLLSNFLLSAECCFAIPPPSLARACAEALRDFNPMVAIHTLPGGLSEESGLTGVQLSDFDALLLGPCSRSLQLKANEACRNASSGNEKEITRKSKRPVAFFYGVSKGLCGELFADLQHHSCNEKDTEYHLLYPSMQEALNVPWTQFPRKTPPVLFAFRVVEEMEKRMLKSELKSLTSQEITTEVNRILEEKGVRNALKKAKVEETALHLVTSDEGKEYPPISAIMGGILGQEVVRCISGKGKPVHNFFHFSAISSQGVMTSIAPSSH